MSVEGKYRYRKWLKQSEHWETVRLYAMGFQKMECQGCGKVDPNNHAHHIFYPPSWNLTSKRHLRILCRNCHERIHELTTPSEYKIFKEARRAFLPAINGIRVAHGLEPFARDSDTTQGVTLRREAIKNRKSMKTNSFSNRFSDEFDLIALQ